MPTPKLGQHFLTNHEVIDKIITAADLSKKDTVLEVGPGRGILTAELLKAAGTVVAVEKDGELHHKLKKKFKDSDNFELSLGDIRNFHLGLMPKNYKVVANIPYYLTGQLIPWLLTSQNPPSLSVLMIQNEVADRLTGPKGSGNLLQLASQVFAEPQKVFFVPREDFDPAPNVDSAVITLKKHKKDMVPAGEQRSFFRILKFAFSGKRKKITNTLSAALKVPREQILKALEQTGLSENARPQELLLAEWIQFYNQLK